MLAVRGEPAEVAAGAATQLEALVVSPAGEVEQGVEWSFCMRPRGSAERTGVTQSCLLGEDLEATQPSARIPSDACARFGPNPPPPEGEQPPTRPADPDPSGGYYVPIRALATVEQQDAVAFGFQRIRCDLPAVTRDIFDAYQERYTLNQNPEIAALELVRGELARAAVGSLTIEPGEALTLRLLPAEGASENYVLFRAGDSELTQRRETLTVSWFVTAGELGVGSESRSAQQLEGSARFENTWRAPRESGRVSGWVVLRDDRGGTSWSSFAIEVER